MIWGDIITNITGTSKRRVDLVFGIGYSDDMAKAQKILEDILAGHELILKDPKIIRAPFFEGYTQHRCHQ